MKVALFGGTFDPFTVAHRDIVRTVLREGLVDHVAIVPTIVDYYRDKDDRWLSHKERVRVIQAMLADEIKAKKVTIDVHEYDLLESTATRQIDLLKASRRFIHTLYDLLDGDYGDHELHLILGTDQYERFTSWFCWEEILKYVKLIVVTGRDGQADLPPTAVPVSAIGATIRISNECAHVSATAVRKAYRGKPAGFSQYIDEFKHETRNVLLHTPIFDVVKGPEVKPGFRPVQLKAPDWVMVIAENGGKLLTVTQLRYGNMKRVREFVCGQVEPGEDPRDAAIRELREETGYKVLNADGLKLIGAVNPNPAMFDNTAWVYCVNLGATAHVKEEQDLDEHEELEVGWVSSEEAVEPCRVPLPSAGVPALYMCAMAMYARHKLRENKERNQGGNR